MALGVEVISVRSIRVGFALDGTAAAMATPKFALAASPLVLRARLAIWPAVCTTEKNRPDVGLKRSAVIRPILR